jgi:hypothetical protein
VPRLPGLHPQPEDIDRVHDMVENLESLTDIRQLIDLLAPSPKV